MKNALIITHVCGFLYQFEMDNVRILQELGYRVHYAANPAEIGYAYPEDAYEKAGVIFHPIEIARSPYMFSMNRQALKELIRIVDEEEIDLIHCHTPVGGVLGRLAGRWNHRPVRPKVIYTAHGFHFYKGAPLLNNTVYYLAEFLCARLTDSLVVINREDFKSAAKLPLRKKGRIFQIPGIGIERSRFLAGDEIEKKRLREQYGIPADTFLILSVGELNENKNHKTAIEAAARIMRKYPERKLLYGICGEGFYREDVQLYINELGIPEQIFLWGYQKNIRDFYAMADITIFPSRREGFGMAGLESLAMGIPIIASDNRGTREYVVDKKNGFVVSAMDTNAYEKAIETFLSMSSEEYLNMREQGMSIAERFEKSIVSEIMKQAYMETLDRD